MFLQSFLMDEDSGPKKRKIAIMRTDSLKAKEGSFKDPLFLLTNLDIISLTLFTKERAVLSDVLMY
jgi:hypothetical protein